MFGFCSGCVSANQPSSSANDLVEIVELYKVKYFDQDIGDRELLEFFVDGVKSEYQKQKDQDFRFLKGLLPTSLNAPVLIVEPEVQEERNCRDVHFEDVPDSNRCLLIVGKTIDQRKRKIVLVFSLVGETLKISNVATFNSVD
jgi:hypothetical protein